MRLKELLGGIQVSETVGSTEIEVSAISTDSRRAAPGSLFACIRGGRHDGHDYAGQAAEAGAAVILAEEPVEVGRKITQVLVEEVRPALARVSACFYGRPSEELQVIGVTGTNGKTTTVHLVKCILEAAGKSVGVLGTLGHWLGADSARDPFTTPEAPSLQNYMRRMVESGVQYCVMEVSSHAISLHRADAVDFDLVGFTNLTQDHLDFHGDLDRYRRAKMKLFGIDDRGYDFGPRRRGVINTGDPTGEFISEKTPLSFLTYSIGGEAGITGEIVELSLEGSRLRVRYGSEELELESSLKGRINAENVLAAFTIALALDLDPEDARKGIRSMPGLPGRMEFFEGAGRRVVVDYAHTPDALEQLLEDLKRLGGKRLLCVFGCGGDRDRGKRPTMGEIAARFCDLTLVTSDNPRTEEPLEIIEDILGGISNGSAYEVLADRSAAIRRAVEASRPGDIVVVAGKGHEDYQIIGEQRMHFDDREEVRKALGDIIGA
jgi:UDP-N-acetylmuramoyl-L-alanyl-D-glutamate--2,6-diaminopimelate ligase